jgi:hypothetical protein
MRTRYEPEERRMKRWYGEGKRGVLLERNLTLPMTKLQCKVLVFETVGKFRAFFRKEFPFATSMDTPFCRGCCYVPLQEVVSFKGGVESKPVMYVDPKFFALICLVKGHCHLEVIPHECVHAAFALWVRKSRNPDQDRWVENGLQEEEVCYPAGRLTRMISYALNVKGLLKI